MRRVLLGMGLGILLGLAMRGTVQAQEAPELERLEDVEMEFGDKTAFKLPAHYGRLAGVAINNEVHYLYFEDRSGSVRIVLVGPRSALQRSRQQMQLLNAEVSVIKRGEGDAS